MLEIKLNNLVSFLVHKGDKLKIVTFKIRPSKILFGFFISVQRATQ